MDWGSFIGGFVEGERQNQAEKNARRAIEIEEQRLDLLRKQQELVRNQQELQQQEQSKRERERQSAELAKVKQEAESKENARRQGVTGSGFFVQVTAI